MSSTGWALPSSTPVALDLSEIIEAEKYEKRRIAQQIKEDSDLAKQVAAFESLEKSEVPVAPQPASTQSNVPCSSKTADLLETLEKDDTDDRRIAELLQAEFDLEYDEQVKRLENARNKNSKVSVSFANYRIYPDELLQNSDEKEDEDEIERRRAKNWDRFEENDKEISKIGKAGYFEDENGKIRTKHDMEMTGRKNAGKIMNFHADFSSGDCGNFDMKISNKVFNELRQYSFSMAKKSNQQLLDRQENAKTSEMGMDQKTRLLLYKLINTSMILESIDGIISKGKEAVVLHGEGNVHNEDMEIPKEIAIKIFSTTLNEFKQRDRYIKDDFRFKGHVKQNNRNIFQLWTEKEFHNLHRLRKAGINCPTPIVFKKHVLLMSYIGKGHDNPARKLKDVALTQGEMIAAYDEVIEIMKKMYNDARLVHADFSEYNLLYHDGSLVVIDLAQAIEPCHPSAFEFLMRDCHNITSFFERNQVPVKTKEELFFEITNLDPLTSNVNMLEKIHMKGEAAHVVTTPHNLDENLQDKLPEKHRLKEFPFDYAWKKVEEFKKKNESLNDESIENEEDSWVEVTNKRKSAKRNEA